MNKRILIFIMVVAAIMLVNAKTILFIGDSITDGNWGSPKKYPCSSDERNQTDLNHIMGHGFAEMTAGYYMGNYPNDGYYFINRGISGETLPMIAERWDKDAMQYSPDVISLLYGANDIHNWLKTSPKSVEEFDFATYRHTVDSIIDVTRRKLPDCEIVLCSPFAAEVGKIADSGDFSLREEANVKMGEILAEIATHDTTGKTHYIDFNGLLGILQSEKGEMKYWMWDGIHPTTAMHNRMARYWIEQMDSILQNL